MKVVLGMLFFFLSNTDIRFAEQELEWRRYITTKALPTKKRVELINCKEFATAILNSKEKAFVWYIALLRAQNIVYLSYRTQIAFFISNDILVEISKEYTEYADVFSKEVATELPKYIRINGYPINLEKSKQLFYELIYSL